MVSVATPHQITTGCCCAIVAAVTAALTGAESEGDAVAVAVAGDADVAVVFAVDWILIYTYRSSISEVFSLQ